MSFIAWFIVTVVGLLQALIGAYLFVMFIYFVTRLLISFGGIPPHNPIVQFILQIGGAIIEPVLTPIRRFVPPVNGIDLSMIVLWVILYFISSFLGFLSVELATSFR